MSSYYSGETGAAYFARRAKCRDARIQRHSAQLFHRYIPRSATVLDFGCGTGGIIEALLCARRMGVEVADRPAEVAKSKGIEVYKTVAEVPDTIADVVITHHALEHTPCPWSVLSALHAKLKPGGRIVVVVPAEEPRRRGNRRWRPNADQHLYCWNPKTLGNLLIAVGFKLEESRLVTGGYSRYFAWAEHIPYLLVLLTTVYAWLRSRYHTVCVALREETAIEGSESRIVSKIAHTE